MVGSSITYQNGTSKYNLNENSHRNKSKSSPWEGHQEQAPALYTFGPPVTHPRPQQVHESGTDLNHGSCTLGFLIVMISGRAKPKETMSKWCSCLVSWILVPDINKETKIWRNSSICKVFATQAWVCEFDPQNLCKMPSMVTCAF